MTRSEMHAKLIKIQFFKEMLVLIDAIMDSQLEGQFEIDSEDSILSTPPVDPGDNSSDTVTTPHTAQVVPVQKITLLSRLNPNWKLVLILYSDSSSAHKYRARLCWAGTSSPYVEHYCDSIKEAKQWAYSQRGEAALAKKLQPEDLNNIEGGILFKMVLSAFSNDHTIDHVQSYFSRHEDLLMALSQKPVDKMTVSDYQLVLHNYFGDCSRKEINAAITNINTILNLCTFSRILQKQVRLSLILPTHDKFLRATKCALAPHVMTDEILNDFYTRCKNRIEENGDDYCMAALLSATMRIKLDEIAGLSFSDIHAMFEDTTEQDTWTMPSGSPLVICIRRFFRKISVGDDGGSEFRLTMVESEYRYRSIPVPPHTEPLLRAFVAHKEGHITGKDHLISSRSEPTKRATPDAINKAIRRLLEECGIRKLDRTIFIPSKDGITNDSRKVLTATTQILHSTCAQHLTEVCKFEPHELQFYQGLSPYDTIDAHYWDPHTLLAQLRMYAKLARWDLRSLTDSQTQCLVSTDSREHTISPPIGKNAGAHLILHSKKEGTPIIAYLKALYGLQCSYIIEHSEKTNHS